jgi:Transmembrane protein of unknown function (DUF3556)
MGFINPAPAPFDVEEWKRKPHLERIKPLAQDWAVNGFGTPYAIYLLYIVKLALFCFGAVAVISTTKGLGSISNFNHWWGQPIVYEKVLVWMVVYEMIGLGSSSMALSFRFIPPFGCILNWARPGTVRLPPWPDKVPFTKGNRRTILDVALYLGVLGTGIALLASSGVHPGPGHSAGLLSKPLLGTMIGLWVALGLRDKVSYLCGRPEVYGIALVVALFPIDNLIAGWKIALLCVWFGAATSKLNRHFGSVVAVMIANTPWQRSKTVKRRLWKGHPDDLRASHNASLAAHTGTVIEYGLPLALAITHGAGTVGTIAIIGMVVFHIHITSTFPLAVPLEWNLYMIFGVLFLFGHYDHVAITDIHSAPLVALLLLNGIVIPLLGNMRPDKISFLPSMRYYAGNWATSQWLFRNDAGAEEKFDRTVVKSSRVVANQLARLYDPDMADIFLSKALAFRAMHPHGRALNGLLPHAAVGGEVEDYTVREGEFLCGAVVGWNFGDGHFHGKQLLDAVQEQCRFAPGELRVITLESQPIQVQQQRYAIWDAAEGLVETGTVHVADMISRQPWLGGGKDYDFPVHVDAHAAEREQVLVA